ncbi:MAG: hypothetical protein ACLVJ6_07390 [Merdibacter sp.]
MRRHGQLRCRGVKIDSNVKCHRCGDLQHERCRQYDGRPLDQFPEPLCERCVQFGLVETDAPTQNDLEAQRPVYEATLPQEDVREPIIGI